MNTNIPTPTHTSDPGWQILGELKLSLGINMDNTIHVWLTEILAPLNLSSDFLERVLTSAQASAARTPQPDPTTTIDHVHLSIFAPREHIMEEKTWGFFHTEKIGNQAEGAVTHDHAIEFYLYVEGE